MDVQTQIDIDASPGRVWAVLVDFEGHAGWNPLMRDIRGEVREAARLHIRFTPPGERPTTLDPIVTRVDPPRSLSWRWALLARWVLRGEHAFRVEPLGPNRTRLHHGESFGGVLVPVLGSRLRAATRRGFISMNEALKAEAEAGP
ncbi:MAG TPA: SRPBCC domain-containing protein [Rubricoccaceae bacterium]|jgi:hypothetical protein|nr:SRPBCC domain-containing protein [Rubricoccaceae bacterium]